MRTETAWSPRQDVTRGVALPKNRETENQDRTGEVSGAGCGAASSRLGAKRELHLPAHPDVGAQEDVVGQAEAHCRFVRAVPLELLLKGVSVLQHVWQALLTQHYDVSPPHLPGQLKGTYALPGLVQIVRITIPVVVQHWCAKGPADRETGTRHERS